MSAHSVGPCAVVDGHYPCIREITGYSFKISIVMSATDLTFEDALKREADAQLIAAAPDLLEQLSSLLAMCERQEDFNDDGDGCMFEHARAAVAKATGGAA